ncbi:MAG: ComF family protein [Firmicutes bacterium]|nr:ComF family protein [Bacillota bacterium]
MLSGDYAHNLCNNCMDYEDAHYFERGFTCMMYGLYEKELLKAFKYHNRPYYASALGEMMYDRIAPEGVGADLVVPVPLHRKKLRERGYNQAELLAHEVALRMELPMVRALMRTRYTKPMSKISGAERSANLMDEGAKHSGKVVAEGRGESTSVFSVNPLYASVLNGQRILLIDDIYTTGATADACSRALLDAGCEAVFVLTVASAGNPPPQG